MASRPAVPAPSAFRQTLPLLLANLWHGVSGFVIFVVAARVMEEGEFGRLSLAMALALAVEELVKGGVPRAVSHHVARATAGPAPEAGGPCAIAPIVRRGLRLNLAYALGGAAAVGIAAWPTAGWLGDGDLALLIALGGLDMVVFVPYTVYLATLNGLHSFRRQALLMAAYSTQKAIVLVSLVAWGGAAIHGVAGYLVGSSFGSLLAWAMVRGEVRAPRGVAVFGGAAEEARPPRLGSVGLPLALFGVLMALFLNVDFAAFRAGLELRHGGDVPAAALDSYAGAVHIARMVFFVFLAFGESLFPSISRVMLHEARAVGAQKVRASLGALALLLLPSIALGAATGGATAALLFGEGFRAAGAYLPALLGLAGLLVVVHTLASAVAASGAAWRVFAAVGLGVAANVAGNVGLVGVHPLAPALTAIGAALLMLAVLAPGVVGAFGWRWIPWHVLPGAFVAAAVAWAGGRAVERDDLWLFAHGTLVLAVALAAGFGLAAGAKRVAGSAARQRL